MVDGFLYPIYHWNGVPGSFHTKLQFAGSPPTRGMMTRDELIAAIIDERERVISNDTDRTMEHYDRLHQHYGITQAEDTIWLDILGVLHNGLSIEQVLQFGPEDQLNAEMFEDVQRFLEDERAVEAFLNKLLKKYQSGKSSLNPTST